LSEELDDPLPNRTHVVLWWLNVVALVAIAGWAASLPFDWLYTAMNDGVALPDGYASSITSAIWWLVGPLLVLNVLWLMLAARRWRQRSDIAEPPSHLYQQQPASPHVRAQNQGEAP
jgi:hypothetical protein